MNNIDSRDKKACIGHVTSCQSVPLFPRLTRQPIHCGCRPALGLLCCHPPLAPGLQAQEAGEAKVMIELAVSKLKRCLELRPQEHKAEWCLGQCHHALGFMTEEQSEAAALFAVRSA